MIQEGGKTTPGKEFCAFPMGAARGALLGQGAGLEDLHADGTTESWHHGSKESWSLSVY